MSLVSVEKEAFIGWIILNRPEKYNALNIQLMKEMISAANELDNDDIIKIIVLTGQGKTFSSGIDLSEIASLEKPEDIERIFSTLREVFIKYLSISKPLIIALNGDAYGGGAELIWTGDVVISVEDAKIGWVESRWGLIPPALTTIGLYQLGFSKASLIALTSGIVSVKELYEVGVVAKLVPKEELREEARKLARSIVETSSPEAISSIRKITKISKLKLLDELGLSELLRLSRSSELIIRAKNFIEKKQIPKYF